MKISKIYSNQPIYFKPIFLNDGLNVILAEIKLPENKNKDTHNLGKSTLGQIINYCLMARVDKDFFLLETDKFKDFVFFIELKLLDNTYLTIRRSVNNQSKASFKKHLERNRDFSKSSDSQWDHLNVSFDKSKELLSSLLGFDTIKPLSYRDITGYLIRSQDDYSDVFALNKFRFGAKHSQWKPKIAKLLGFDFEKLKSCYELEQKISELKLKDKELFPTTKALKSIKPQLADIEGMLALKITDRDEMQKEVDSFNFSEIDKKNIDFLVKGIGSEINDLNKKCYYIDQDIKMIDDSLSQADIKFSLKEAEDLFNDAGILFAGQIKKDLNQLINFNEEIVSERKKYLEEDRKELISHRDSINTRREVLNSERAKLIKSLESDSFLERYKKLADQLAHVNAEIGLLQDQRDSIIASKEIKTIIKAEEKILETMHEDLEKSLAENVASESKSVFSLIRFNFGEIIKNVLSQKAMLTINLNGENHFEFDAVFLDDTGNSTSASKGNSYRKLLCIAFDLALLKSYLDQPFPRFVFHDGVFEKLDDRKSENLLEVMRGYAEQGIQQIITLIDSDVPKHASDGASWFKEEEIVKKLNDLGSDGRLFNMEEW